MSVLDAQEARGTTYEELEPSFAVMAIQSLAVTGHATAAFSLLARVEAIELLLQDKGDSY